MKEKIFNEDLRKKLKEIVKELKKSFSYVSILGTNCLSEVYRADKKASSITEGNGERGYVVKMTSGNAFYEYSLSDLSEEVPIITSKILSSLSFDKDAEKEIVSAVPEDIPLKKSFKRENDFSNFSDEEILGFCKKLKDKILASDKDVLNAIVYISPYTVSKIFVTNNRELDQSYGWVNGRITVVYKGEKTVRVREGAYGNDVKTVFDNLLVSSEKIIEKAKKISKAKPIVPGVYDVITDSSITGLIAHEAFGHGVEMDQFVKERALAKKYIDKYVASPIVNMHDGAAATLSVASYFFDDDGVLAEDTKIIENGVLLRGISDLTSASELGTKPTGNGRRESYKRKAYTRMTNTFFEKGRDKLDDMIKSVKHGYMLFETNNGMEDPKNWQIQCTAEYGIEIVDGKLTDNYVSPVVMSGSVPELLKSISMISDDFVVSGEGQCGKGYKEWVRVSDGGPCLKARVKLA